ncbi:hypothetical protein ACGFIG_18520 [Micromonospora sp. NPDC049048]|uniref:hypothetical protein n=1 Tax=Micromonospora sp. NPDC049048 TaxID=3364263 RepID=UPI003720636D
MTLEGVQLLPGRVVDVADRLSGAGFTTRAIDSGLAIADAGVKLYVPSTEQDAAVEAVSAAPVDAVDLDASFFGEPGESKIEVWPVDAHHGIAGVRLGQMRSEVRQRMGEGMHSVVSATRSMDHYWTEGIVAKFDADDRVVDVIALAPAKPAMGDIEVLGRSYGELSDALTTAGFSIREAPAELYVEELGASVWWSRDSEEPLPSVAVAVGASQSA